MCEGKDDNDVKLAIRVANIKIDALCAILGLSKPRVLSRLEDPTTFKLSEFFILYHELDDDARFYLSRYLDSLKA